MVRERILRRFESVSLWLISLSGCVVILVSVSVKTLNLPDELWELLDLEAAREDRSRSKMAARLLGDALAGRGSAGGTSTPASAAVPPRPVSASEPDRWPVTGCVKPEAEPAREPFEETP